MNFRWLEVGDKAIADTSKTLNEWHSTKAAILAIRLPAADGLNESFPFAAFRPELHYKLAFILGQPSTRRPSETEACPSPSILSEVNVSDCEIAFLNAALMRIEPLTPQFTAVTNGIVLKSSYYLAIRDTGYFRIMHSTRTLPFPALLRAISFRVNEPLSK
ncbi:hypothetical protein BMW22_41690 (plasmid) [Rhizobium leguminosarum]|uniref:Uncharacterized protein n=1 Tax=Rhizobium leguminosarum TaxID=384 RepID=A0A1L3ZQ43_RHILE|nr:hypothetical protein [Rhizobium leguminosarum]API57773.1 hypothetical protein BMW22_41690 [Rhizobium leguminosarum]